MATLEQIGEALRRADAAGHAEDARALAQAYQSMQQGKGAVPPTSSPAEVATPSNWPGRAESLAQGASFGFSDEIQGFAKGAANKLSGGDYMPAYESGRDQARQRLSEYSEREPVISTALQMAGGVVPALMTGGGSAPATIGQAAIRGAATGGAAGAMYGFGSGEGGTGNRLVGAAETGLLGAAVGGAAPYVYDAGRRGAQYATGQWNKAPLTQAVLPAEQVAPETAQLFQRAQQLGVPIRPGQLSTSPMVRTTDDAISRLPGAGYSATDPNRISNRAQREAFSKALSGTFGENSPVITQQTMANAKNRITGVMNSVIEKNRVQADDELVNALSAVDARAREVLDDAAKPVTDKLDKIVKQLSEPDGLTGRLYQSWRERDGLLSALSDNDNKTVSALGRRIGKALDEAFERQAPSGEGAALKQARAQYRNMKIVEPLSAKAPTGEISPALLLGEVRGEYPDFAYKGAGDIGDLARIGQAFLKAPPNSGTAERSLALSFAQNPLSATLRTGVGIAGGRLVNEAINSPAYLARLLGQPVPVAPPMPGAGIASTSNAALLARLLAQPANESSYGRQQ